MTLWSAFVGMFPSCLRLNACMQVLGNMQSLLLTGATPARHQLLQLLGSWNAV